MYIGNDSFLSTRCASAKTGDQQRELIRALLSILAERLTKNLSHLKRFVKKLLVFSKLQPNKPRQQLIPKKIISIF